MCLYLYYSIFSLGLYWGSFSTLWKQAAVILLFQKGNGAAVEKKNLVKSVAYIQDTKYYGHGKTTFPAINVCKAGELIAYKIVLFFIQGFGGET
jgi:hypothetical protein